MTLADDIDLQSINKEYPDLSGSQIAALCSEAALQCLRKEMDTINIHKNAIDCEILKNLKVT
jgi:transitional endoplasmic reticulum ATPase